MTEKELIKVTMPVTMDLRKAMMKAKGLSRIQTYEKGGKLTVTLQFKKNRDLVTVSEVIKKFTKYNVRYVIKVEACAC